MTVLMLGHLDKHYSQAETPGIWNNDFFFTMSSRPFSQNVAAKPLGNTQISETPTYVCMHSITQHNITITLTLTATFKLHCGRPTGKQTKCQHDVMNFVNQPSFGSSGSTCTVQFNMFSCDNGPHDNGLIFMYKHVSL